MSNKDWNPDLTPEQNYVLRQEGTESPGSSPLNNEKREGSYHCVGCGTKLFDSSTKYESGSGWPSFFKSLPDVLRKKQICTLDSQEQNIIVKNAAGIMAMYLKTAQNLPENVIATTACVYFLNQRVK